MAMIRGQGLAFKLPHIGGLWCLRIVEGIFAVSSRSFNCHHSPFQSEREQGG